MKTIKATTDAIAPVTKKTKSIHFITRPSLKICNRGKPIHITELKDIDATLQKELMIWFEQRGKEVRIDPKTNDGALKKEAIAQLVTALKRRHTGSY